MAAIAIPAIEAAAARVLVALGVGAAAEAGSDAVLDAARRRREAAEKAAATPLAKADACTKGSSRPACKDCPPDRGVFSYRNTAGWSDFTITYQQRISGMPPAPMPGHITEWNWMGVEFDGFESDQCLLKEAKAKYDQFFDDFGFRRDFWTGDEALFAQATRQSTAATPQPPVRLRWYFMQPLSYRYFSRLFASASLRIETVWQA